MIDHRPTFNRKDKTLVWSDFEREQKLLEAEYAKEMDCTFVNPEELQLGTKDRTLIGLGKMRCPLCHDRFTIWPLYKGGTTGVVFASATPCPCGDYRRYIPEFLKKCTPTIGTSH